MNIIEKDISHTNAYEVHCPYCDQIIFSSMPQTSCHLNPCEHLYCIYGDDNADFIEPSESLKEMHDKAYALTGDDFDFYAFVEALGATNEMEDTTRILLQDTYDSLWLWFKPKGRIKETRGQMLLKEVVIVSK